MNVSRLVVGSAVVLLLLACKDAPPPAAEPGSPCSNESECGPGSACVSGTCN